MDLLEQVRRHSSICAMDNTLIDAPMIQSRSMGGSAATATHARHGETPVTPIPLYKSIVTPFRPTTQAICGFYRNYQYIPDGGTGGTERVHHLSIRLNSIVDMITLSIPPSGDAAPSAQGIDANGSVEYPMWRDYWFNFYQYWTVVACEYKIKIYLTSPVVNNSTQLATYFYHHGRDGPPIFSSGTTSIPHYIRAQHPNVSWQYINPGENLIRDAATDIEHFGRNSRNNFIEYNGCWKPGMTPHSVVEDEFNKIWLKQNEAPPQIEKLTIITQAGPEHKGTGDNLARTYDITLKYHVQFKDLKQKYHYITQATTVDAISAVPFNIQVDANRPAGYV